MNNFCLPEQVKIVNLLFPQHDGSLTSDAVSLKNCNKAWVEVVLAQTEVDRCTITLMQATDVAIGTNKVPTNVCNLWYNEDLDAADTLTLGTAAKTYKFSATHDKNKAVIFEIDPVTYFDVENNYDCLYLTSGGSNVAHFISAKIFMDMKYREDVLPSAITD